MEDSLKGVLVTLTVAALFTTCILSFIVIFPQEQGVSFADLQSNTTYLTIQNNTDFGTEAELDTINNQSQSGFDQWDLTEGFMGSNTIKQNADTGVKDLNSNVFSTLLLIAKKLFGTGSPIIYALSILSGLSVAYITYLAIKFARQGQ